MTQKTSINNSLFSFHITSTDNNIGETGAESLCEALKSNTTLTKLDQRCKDKRKKTHKRHPSTIYSFPFTSHQQTTRLETQEQSHWVKHWNQTQLSLNSILVVNTKERRHTKDIHQQFTLFRHTIKERNLRYRDNNIEWIIEIKHNTHCNGIIFNNQKWWLLEVKQLSAYQLHSL